MTIIFSETILVSSTDVFANWLSIMTPQLFTFILIIVVLFGCIVVNVVLYQVIVVVHSISRFIPHSPFVYLILKLVVAVVFSVIDGVP